ncbi:MAG TPA: CDP-glycerol glycerophosphotransferase family protein, partial [Balneolales bacterium]|nr:CDP-glycerol glycerophosphotransferase family protein [Balneolales bacterium]
MFYLYHKAAFDPLIRVFEADPNFDVYLSLTHEIERKFKVFEIDKTQKYIEQFRQAGHQISDENEQFDIVICPDTLNESLYGKTMLCFVNHGTGIKNVLFRNLEKHKAHHYNIFVEGQYRVDALEQSGSLHGSEVFKVGLPKLDPIFQDGFFNRDVMLTALGLSPEKQTVLFAPTYKPTCIYDVKDAIFAATQEYNLIVKLHHYAWMGKFAHHSQHKIMERRISRHDHAVLIPKDDYNIIPLMAVSDTLVSEASSTVFDFLATGKHGVIYDLPHDKLVHSDGQPLLNIDNRIFLKDAFVHVGSPEELEAGIHQALYPTDAMISAAATERNYYFHQLDGRASERTRDEILRLYHEGTHLNNPERM